MFSSRRACIGVCTALLLPLCSLAEDVFDLLLAAVLKLRRWRARRNLLLAPGVDLIAGVVPSHHFCLLCLEGIRGDVLLEQLVQLRHL